MNGLNEDRLQYKEVRKDLVISFRYHDITYAVKFHNNCQLFLFFIVIDSPPQLVHSERVMLSPGYILEEMLLGSPH